ncbi:uncharacterized protein SCODWIG_01827 [Saccharomycodes ludwigii]|uniref:Mitochondrial group I intron splicing factor CCM1 n=1 Tax=Saccharomycodes ludwigii TaxID=36035 RepID=A0A376B5T3_9ASCO|nr:hypothetical protein SCDLUD_000844 [Saccharomycodes ludwigii]KAH3903225.1 hypothetical protein SCDLUD_000844 [Saccharomycodes ludwigii]SSD60066.1 uncharacterized protein SCODWIG_01827 [Saccharomycodes ludwigii]
MQLMLSFKSVLKGNKKLIIKQNIGPLIISAAKQKKTINNKIEIRCLHVDTQPSALLQPQRDQNNLYLLKIKEIVYNKDALPTDEYEKKRELLRLVSFAKNIKPLSKTKILNPSANIAINTDTNEQIYNSTDTTIDNNSTNDIMSSRVRSDLAKLLFKNKCFNYLLLFYNISIKNDTFKFPKDIRVHEFNMIFHSILKVEGFTRLLFKYLNFMFQQFNIVEGELSSQHQSNGSVQNSDIAINNSTSSKRSMIIKVLSSLLSVTYESYGFKTASIIFMHSYSFMQGHCDFSSPKDYLRNRDILEPLMIVMQKNEKSYRESMNSTVEFDYYELLTNLETSFAVNVHHLVNVKYTSSKIPVVISQYASTLQMLVLRRRMFDKGWDIWKYKYDHHRDLVEINDLTGALRILVHKGNYGQVQKLYEEFPHLHNFGEKQFDYLLIAYSKLKSWDALQKQFNKLFGIGELPNVLHYGIIMYALADYGELEIVDSLYKQLLNRKLIPNYAVLQSLLYAYYKNGDYQGALHHFELFKKYDVRPQTYTYLILLDIYRTQNDLDGALMVLKKMNLEQRELISSRHFEKIFRICAYLTNIPIAEELFHLMRDEYNITPTPALIASLMDVYSDSKQPTQAVKIFNNYIKEDYIQSDDVLKIYMYNSLIYAKTLLEENCDSLFLEISEAGIRTNSEFYRVMLNYLISLKKDVEASGKLLNHMLEHSPGLVLPAHFEIIMRYYDCHNNSAMIFSYYEKLLNNKIPVNSKILHYVVKHAFITNISKTGSSSNIKKVLRLLNDIMESSANRTLDIVHPVLHPGVIIYPIKQLVTYDPVSAWKILYDYIRIFYKSNPNAILTKFRILKTKAYVYYETQQWEELALTFDDIMNRITNIRNGPTSKIMRNLNLDGLLIGVFNFKLEELHMGHRIGEIPSWIKKLRENSLVIDNKSYNSAIRLMIDYTGTRDYALNLINNLLIKGFNRIHMLRLMKKHYTDFSTSSNQLPKDLIALRADPSYGRPTYYLESNVYEEVKEKLDKYLSSLNNLTELENILESWTKKYPRFIIGYLMKPKNNVAYWYAVEARHKEFLQELRTSKRTPKVKW